MAIEPLELHVSQISEASALWKWKHPKLFGVGWKTGRVSWTWIHINLDKKSYQWLLEERINFPSDLAIPERINRCIATSLFVFNQILALLIDLDASCPGPSATMSPEHLILRMPMLRTCCFLVLALLIFIGIVIGSFQQWILTQLSKSPHSFPGENRNELGIELIEHYIHIQSLFHDWSFFTSKQAAMYSLSDICMELQSIDEYNWI